MKFVNSISFNTVLTTVFFTALVWYFAKNHRDLEELLAVSFAAVFLISVLKILRIFITGLQTKFILEAFQKSMSVKEASYLAWITSTGNFFGPILGGASIRAVYLKKKHNFEYSKFISTLYGFYIITFLISSTIGLLLLGYIYDEQGRSPALVAIALVFVAILLINIILITLPPQILRKLLAKLKFIPPRLTNILGIVIEGWATIRANTVLLGRLSTISLAVLVIATLESYVLFGLYVDEFNIVSVLLYTILGSLSLLISITPGAIGIKEAIFFFSSSVIVIDSAEILQLAAVDRSITFAILLIAFAMIKLSSVEKRIQKNLQLKD